MTTAKAKSNSIISRLVELGEGVERTLRLPAVISFRVEGANGSEPGFARIDLGKLHLANLARALVHGLVQRVQDSAAVVRDPKNLNDSQAKKKLGLMTELVEHLNSGAAEWTLAREGGLRGSFLLNALCELFPEKDREKLNEKVKGWSEAQRRAMEMSSEIKPLIDAQRAKGGEGVDIAELMQGLDEI